MRPIILSFMVLLASCGTVHKVFNSSKNTVDSVASSSRDTSHVSHETASSDNFSAKDVHIRVEYDTARTGDHAVIWEPYYTKDTLTIYSGHSPAKTKTQTYGDLIRQAIASSGGAGRIPSSITIDIGSIQDSSSRSEKKDSGSVHATSTANVHKTDSEKGKEVTRTGIPLVGKMGIVLVIVLILVYLVYRCKKHIFPL